EFVWDAHDCLPGSQHVFGIAAIQGKAGGKRTFTPMELAPLAGAALPAWTAVPAYPDALADPPFGRVLTGPGDHTDHLVSGDARVLQAGIASFADHGIAVTNAA